MPAHEVTSLTHAERRLRGRLDIVLPAHQITSLSHAYSGYEPYGIDHVTQGYSREREFFVDNLMIRMHYSIDSAGVSTSAFLPRFFRLRA